MLKGNLPEGKLDGELECPTEDTDKPLGKHYAFKSVKRISALIEQNDVSTLTYLICCGFKQRRSCGEACISEPHDIFERNLRSFASK